jgi:hypothetical protein
MLAFRHLVVDDIPALLELQETVRRALPHPHIFECEQGPYYTRILAGSGAGFGAFDGAALVAYGIVSFPGVHPENLCHDVPRLAIDPTEVAHLDGSAVAPVYRGLALQQRLTVLRIAFAAEKGARHFLMTVSPLNPHSLRNHLNGGGFRVEAIKQKYGGVWRLILCRSLDSEEPTTVGERDSCALADIDSHQRLLADGFSGIRLVNHEDGLRIAYEKLRD